MAGGSRHTEEKVEGSGEGSGGGEESALVTMIQGNYFTPTGTLYIRIRYAKYLEKVLHKKQYVCISAFKSITLIMPEISPKLARERGWRSMLFNIKLFTRMTFIMLMPKSH